MSQKNYLFISNNKNINIIYEKGNLNIYNKNNKFSSIINLNHINYLEYSNIIYIKNKSNIIFIKSKKDILILSLILKKKIKDNIRGYCLIFNLIGLGFTMTIWKENQLRFNIGYNHLIYYNIPEGILIRSKARRNLFLFSNSFFFLKKIGTEIKNFRKLSVYKLKGIKDKNELYIKKNWKKGIY